jgi:hypothetical protein
VSGPESHAPQNQAHPGAAQITAEFVEDESALQFFFNIISKPKNGQLFRRVNDLRRRIVFGIVPAVITKTKDTTLIKRRNRANPMMDDFPAFCHPGTDVFGGSSSRWRRTR